MANFNYSFIENGQEASPNSSTTLKYSTETGKKVSSPVTGVISEITNDSITVNDGEYSYRIFNVKKLDNLSANQDVTPTTQIATTKSDYVDVKIFNQKNKLITKSEFLTPAPKKNETKQKPETDNSSSSYKDIAPEEDIMGHVIKAYNQPVGQIAKALSTGVKKVFGLKEEIERIKKLLK